MKSSGFGILALVGVAAWAISELANWADDREKHRIQILKWREDSLIDEHNLNMRKEAKHYLQEMVRIIKKDRQDIYDRLEPLRAERTKIKDDFSSVIGKEKRNLRIALWRFDDIIEEKFAEAHLNTVFIDEAYRRIDTMYRKKASSRSAFWARRLNFEEYIKSLEIPVVGNIAQGTVHAPKKNLWFQLETSIRANLVDREKAKRLTAGRSVRLFIEKVNYHDYYADVSIIKAKFVDSWLKGVRKRNATIVNENKYGIKIDIDGIKAFIPSSLAAGLSKGHRDITVELIEVESKLRSVIAKPYSS